MISDLAERLSGFISGLDIRVYPIENNFYGRSITVSGLLTGKDMAEQLSGRELGEELFVPENCLRDGEDVFLCGMTAGEMSEKLGVAVTPSGADGYALVEAILGREI